MNTPLEQMAERIIQEQELIIGPLARAEAEKVSGISFQDGTIKISAQDSLIVLESLVSRFEHLFGPASVAVCRDAAKEIGETLPLEERPSFLRS